MTRIVLLVLSVLATGVTAGAWAQTADIYRIDATVANQSEAERVAAAKANLGEVISRVLGDSAALQDPLVRQAINDAPNYLAKFSYTSDTTIQLNYSPQAIQTLLQQAQLSSASVAGVQAVRLSVVDVRDFTAFKQAQAYLKTVGVIRSANLVSVEKDVLQFDVLLNGDVQLLKNVLGASNKLQPVADDKPLTFRWQN